MRLSRRPLVAGLIVTALAAASLAVAQPASARGLACSPAFNQIQVCAEADLTAAHQARADITNNGSDFNFHSPVVALEICSVGPTNCSVIAQASDVGHIWTFFVTAKPYSFGHVYCAVGSWIDSTGAKHSGISSGCTA